MMCFVITIIFIIILIMPIGLDRNKLACAHECVERLVFWQKALVCDSTNVSDPEWVTMTVSMTWENLPTEVVPLFPSQPSPKTPRRKPSLWPAGCRKTTPKSKIPFTSARSIQATSCTCLSGLLTCVSVEPFNESVCAAISYVPGYYDHAVLNLKDSFGVAMQVRVFFVSVTVHDDFISWVLLL